MYKKCLEEIREEIESIQNSCCFVITYFIFVIAPDIMKLRLIMLFISFFSQLHHILKQIDALATE
jgi:hypothetical protein